MLFKSGDIALIVPITPDWETVWLTQDQVIELFDTAGSSIVHHIGRIFNEGELITIGRKIWPHDDAAGLQKGRCADHNRMDRVGESAVQMVC